MKKTGISKEIHFSSLEADSSQRHFNDKNPSQQLSANQKQLIHTRSNHVDSKNEI